MYDILLKDGLVVDPGNRILGRLHVGIQGGRIACVTDREVEAKRVYDCTGMVVAPGFVDVHAHEDSLDASGELQPVITRRLLNMGVTTFLGGQCGGGPRDEEAYALAYNRQGQPINCALLTGHGALRACAGARDKYAPVTDEQLRAMECDLRARLTAGSYGLSFGIRYIPGIDRREMLALARIVRGFNGIVAAHVRDDCGAVLEALEEFIDIGRETGVRLQVSHIGSMAAYGQMERALALLDAASAEGIDILVDCYPYDAFCTSIGATTYDGDFLARYGGDIRNIEMTDGEYKGRIPSMEVFEKIRREHPEYLTVGHVMRPEEVEAALRHPRVVLGSDGILQNGAGHPRAAGAFARFLRQYVVEKKAVSLYDAIAKMTYIGAERFGLRKGRLSIGWDADVVVFDLQRVRDNATFAEPLLPAEGFRYILIGGEIAVEHDEVVNPALGRMMRKLY